MHQHNLEKNRKKIFLAIALTGVIFIAEFVGGLWTGSLALLSDSAHVFMDVFALGLSYLAIRVSALPALPMVPDAVITAISPSGASKIAEGCAALKIPVFWMPPGTESDDAIEVCRKNQVSEIHGICPVFKLKMPRERWQDLR